MAGNLVRNDEPAALNLGVLLLDGAVVGRVGVMEVGFTWDPGVLVVDLELGLRRTDSTYTCTMYINLVNRLLNSHCTIFVYICPDVIQENVGIEGFRLVLVKLCCTYIVVQNLKWVPSGWLLSTRFLRMQH